MRKTGVAGALAAAGSLVLSCNGSDAPSPIGTTTSTTSTTTTSIPDPSAVTPIVSEGPVRIEFVGSNPPPGSTIANCGGHVEGCRGRLSMTFRLQAPQDARASRMNVFLHATNQIACLLAETGPIPLRAGAVVDVAVVLDRTDLVDLCRTPLTMATMDAVLEGPIEVASRQAWAISYRFDP